MFDLLPRRYRFFSFQIGEEEYPVTLWVRAISYMQAEAQVRNLQQHGPDFYQWLDTMFPIEENQIAN